MNLTEALSRLQVIGAGTPIGEFSAELRFALRGARGRELRRRLAELNQEPLSITAPRQLGKLVEPVEPDDGGSDACPGCGERIFVLVCATSGDRAWFCGNCDFSESAVAH